MQTLMIKDINVKKGDRWLLKDTFLTFELNKVYGIIGNNGAGKTTLFKVILTIIKYNGSIQFDDYEVNAYTVKKYLKEIGFVMPFPEEYDSFTIKELFDEHLHYMDNTLDKNLDVYLRDIGLKITTNMKIKELSLGMKQKLNIALALSHNPSILILDEPFNGLDRQSVYMLKQMINNCKQKDKIILISSHSLLDLEDVIHHIIVFDEGKMKANHHISLLKKKGISLEEYSMSIREGDLYAQ